MEASTFFTFLIIFRRTDQAVLLAFLQVYLERGKILWKNSRPAQLRGGIFVNCGDGKGEIEVLDIYDLLRFGEHLRLPVVGPPENGDLQTVLSYNDILLQSFYRLIGPAFFAPIQSCPGGRGNFND